MNGCCLAGVPADHGCGQQDGGRPAAGLHGDSGEVLAAHLGGLPQVQAGETHRALPRQPLLFTLCYPHTIRHVNNILQYARSMLFVLCVTRHVINITWHVINITWHVIDITWHVINPLHGMLSTLHGMLSTHYPAWSSCEQ
jgi:hypothetical protein